MLIAAVTLGAMWIAAGKTHSRTGTYPLPKSSDHKGLIVPLDEKSKAFLREQRTGWVYVDNGTAAGLADSLSGLMRTAGVVPSIQNLTNVLTSRTTRLRRWLPLARRYPLVADSVKHMFQFLGDGTVRVSEDGHLALSWMHTNTVLVFKDGTNGIEGARYDRKVDRSEWKRMQSDAAQSTQEAAAPHE